MQQASDVTRAQLEKQAQLWRALGPQKQLELADSLWVSGREAARWAFRARHPAASEALIDWLTRAHFVGIEVATRLYGVKPER